MTLEQQFGKYRVEALLGKGGFGTVYKAVDVTLDRVVALKILNPMLLQDETWVRHFQQEARLMARLDHPHIVPIHEIGEVNGRLFIAMKFIDGPTLAEYLQQHGPLSWEQTLAYTEQIASALDYAHQHQIIHRDLKPGNILLGPQGVMLTDFGFSRIMGTHSHSASISGGIVGTPAYLAPEIWQNKPAGKPADIYALACIIFEMLTGTSLFQGDSAPAIMMAHFQPPAFPLSWPHDVPKQIGEILQNTLHLDPQMRPSNATLLLNELQELTQTFYPLFISSEKTDVPKIVRTFQSSRIPLLTLVVLGLFVIGISITGIWFIQQGWIKRTNDQSTMPTLVTTAVIEQPINTPSPIFTKLLETIAPPLGTATIDPNAPQTVFGTPIFGQTNTRVADPTTYVIRAGDTLVGIAEQFGIRLQDLLAANPQVTNPDNPQVGDVLNIPGTANATVSWNAERIHFVQAGENLYRIGLLYGCTVAQLVQYNELVSPDGLVIGQQLLIPVCE